MDITHLTDEELLFELKLRNAQKPELLNRRAKTGKLREILKKEAATSARPTSSTHVFPDSDSCFDCQLRLKELLGVVAKAVKKEDIEQATSSQSRLHHYKFRLSLISDKAFTNAVKKEEAKVEEALRSISRFLNNVSLLDLTPEEQKTVNNEEKETQLSQTEDQGSDNLGGTSNEVPNMASGGAYPKNTRKDGNALGGDGSSWGQWQQHDQNQALVDTGSGSNRDQLQQHPFDSGMGESHLNRQQHNQVPIDAGDGSSRNQSQQNSFNSGNGEPHPSWQQQGPPDIRDELLRHLMRVDPQRQPVAQQQRERVRFTSPIHKWPFSYSGEQNILELAVFLNRVETYARSEDVDDYSLVRGIKHLLHGRAFEWYTRNFATFNKWENFKSEIKKEFLPQSYSQIIKRDLYWRYQHHDESFMNFYRDVTALFEVIEPRLPAEDRYFILKSNLNQEFAAVASASRVATLDQLVSLCKDYDNTKMFAQKYKPNPTIRQAAQQNMGGPGRRIGAPITTGNPWSRGSPVFTRPQQVNVIDETEIQASSLSTALLEQTDQVIQQQEDVFPEAPTQQQSSITPFEEMDYQVNAIRQNTWQNRPDTVRAGNLPVKCWQCEQTGHTFPMCSRPKTYIFCYRCGKKGFISRNCPDCLVRLQQALPEPAIRNLQGNLQQGFQN